MRVLQTRGSRKLSMSAPARRPARSFAGLCSVVAALSAAPRPLRADPARAETLFQEGRALLEAGKADQACLKFAESQRLDPSVGTLLNLGECNEGQGKFASAVSAFLAASQLATARAQPDRASEALRRASLLQPKLSALIVRVGSPTPGLVVKRDGVIVEPAQLGSRVPVDPGQHVITAEASGYLPFRSAVRVEGPAQALTVDVPALTPLARGDAQPAGGQPSRERPVAGYVVGGLGVAALGVGAVFGLMAISNYAKAEDYVKAEDQCANAGPCPERDKAFDTVGRADGQAWVANVGVGLGLVGVAAGSYLLFFAPAKKAGAPAGAGVGLRLTPGSVGLGGRF
ncbi:MAG TPA: hypothetical protein VFS43_36745 [Polyangiaceae bacterium]|nr:hypothetical protein [Polyangiaceae bacterium]